MSIGSLNRRFRRAKTFKRMISDFDYKYPALSALFFMTTYVIIPVVAVVALCLYLQKDTTTHENTAKRTVFRHVIEIERTNGIKDSFIYHDFKCDENITHYDIKAGKRPLTITTRGENVLGVGIDNDNRFDEVKSYKVIK